MLDKPNPNPEFAGDPMHEGELPEDEREIRDAAVRTILRFQDAFVTQGRLPPEKVTELAQIAGDAALKEYKDKKSLDPFHLMFALIREARGGNSPDQAPLMQKIEERLESYRKEWKKLANFYRLGRQDTDMEGVMKKVDDDQNTSHLVNPRNFGKGEKYFAIVHLIQEGDTHDTALIENILRKLGVLPLETMGKQYETIDDLCSLPEQKEGYFGPVYNPGLKVASRLSVTTIPDSDMRIAYNFEKKALTFFVDSKTIEKTVDFNKETKK